MGAVGHRVRLRAPTVVGGLPGGPRVNGPIILVILAVIVALRVWLRRRRRSTRSQSWAPAGIGTPQGRCRLVAAREVRERSAQGLSGRDTAHPAGW